MNRVLTEADAVADLNGTSRPGDALSVCTEDALKVADDTEGGAV